MFDIKLILRIEATRVHNIVLVGRVPTCGHLAGACAVWTGCHQPEFDTMVPNSPTTGKWPKVHLLDFGVPQLRRWENGHAANRARRALSIEEARAMGASSGMVAGTS